MMGKYGIKRRGYLLVMALSLLFVLMVLALALISQGGAALQSSLRSRTANLSEQAVEITKVRFLKAVQPADPGRPTPRETLTPLPLSGEYVVSAPSAGDSPVYGFKVRGNWTDNESIYREIPKNQGKVPDMAQRIGYYEERAQKDSSGKPIKLLLSGFNETQVAPWNSLLAIHTSSNHVYVAGFSPAFPYGAYAPKGNITLGKVASYANPTILMVMNDIIKQGSKYKEHDIFSGLPANLLARDSITVDSFCHGRAVSQNGPIKLGLYQVKDDYGKTVLFTGGGVGIRKTLDDTDTGYASTIVSQIDSAFNKIPPQALDKTNFILGAPFDVVRLVHGSAGSIKGLASLQQAMRFPFITYPLFRIREYPLVTEVKFAFHVPDPPDGSSELSPRRQNERDSDKNVMKKISECWYQKSSRTDPDAPLNPIDLDKLSDDGQEDLHDKQMSLIDLLQSGRKYVDDAAKKAEIDKLIADIKSTYSNYTPKSKDDKGTYPSTAQLESIRDEQVAYYKEIQSYWNGKGAIDPGTPKGAPEDMDSEKNFDNKGHNYLRLMKNILNFMWQLIKGNFDGVLEDLANPTRVVHFKRGCPDITFTPDDPHKTATGFEWTCDLTVPQGRALKLDCDAVIKGDLWIQDGASLYVTGNLKVTDPSGVSASSSAKSKGAAKGAGDFTNPLSPSGRVFLGRGSTIIVSKNFTVSGGSKYLGSITVDSELGNVNYITSAILCKGNITVANGIMPGISLNGLSDYLAEKTGSDAIRTFINNVMNLAPTIAKIAGPFDRRKTFFASYADTFRLEIFDLAPFPVFFPTFEHDSNINCTVFEYVTVIYSAVLNGFLGPHLFTDSEWWIIGKGVVPVLPKIGMVGNVVDMLKYLNPKVLTFTLESLISDLKNKILSFFTADNIESVMKTLLIDALKMLLEKILESTLGVPIPLDKIFGGGPSSSVIDNLKRYYTDFVDDGLKGVMSDIAKQAFDSAKEHMEKALYFKFYEVPGVLVYAGGNLSIGDKDAEKNENMFSAGFFVAKGNVEIYSDLTVGSILSVEGDVTARDFYYYPYFTRASLNVPKKLGLLEDLFLPIIPKSDKDAVDIGITLYHVTGEGWSR